MKFSKTFIEPFLRFCKSAQIRKLPENINATDLEIATRTTSGSRKIDVFMISGFVVYRLHGNIDFFFQNSNNNKFQSKPSK